MKFKPGDRVVCVDDSFCFSIIKGSVYTVERVFTYDEDSEEYFLCVTGNSAEYQVSRFELVSKKFSRNLPAWF